MSEGREQRRSLFALLTAVSMPAAVKHNVETDFVFVSPLLDSTLLHYCRCSVLCTQICEEKGVLNCKQLHWEQLRTLRVDEVSKAGFLTEMSLCQMVITLQTESLFYK